MLSMKAEEVEIWDQARWSAGRVRTLLYSIGKSRPVLGSDELTAQLNSLAIACQAQAVSCEFPLSGRIARMLDAHWWTRNIRRGLLQQNEISEHAAGNIRMNGQCYVSDHACLRKRQRRKKNRTTLEALEVCNENGNAFNLQDIVDSSVSNPKLRRSELMTRCRGFEEMARYRGDCAIFVTLTCPSEFHRFRGTGQLNKKWNNSTPKGAQQYLCSVWARIRASWKRAGFNPYGFRVAEPHHDGCPHWHLLLFCAPTEVGWFDPHMFSYGHGEFGAGLLGIAGRYALEMKSKEAGAADRRFTVKRIDPNKGSATGYIAKYICKNIDGLREDSSSIGLDFESGTDVTVASERVRDWASTWGIRQFQQIGGPSVTVWREMRRMREEIHQSIHAPFDWEMLRSAADRSLWSLYWELQGGPDVKRSELSLRPFYIEDTPGKYGELVSRVFGVIGRSNGNEYALRTRTHSWTVQRAGTAATDFADLEQKEWMHSNKRVREFERAAGLPERSNMRYPMEFSSGQGEALSPWTSVNNCTQPSSTELNFSVFNGPSQANRPDAPSWNGQRSLVWRLGDPDVVAEELLYASREEMSLSLRYQAALGSWRLRRGVSIDHRPS